jgi:hypothetical protein
VVANYYDSGSKTTIQSNTVTFTVTGVATDMMCNIQNLGYVFTDPDPVV